MKELLEESLQTGSEQTSAFTEDLIGLLLEWLSLHRKGQDIAYTPMGFIFRGRPLYESHFFFTTQRRDIQEGSTRTSEGSRRTGSNSGGHEDVDSDNEIEWALMDHWVWLR